MTAVKLFGNGRPRSSQEDTGALDVRRRTYDALGALFADTPEHPQQMVAAAASAPCAWVGQSHLPCSELQDAAAVAQSHLSAPTGLTELKREHRRLFGEPDADAGAALVPTCESVYRSGSAHADRLALESLYDTAGYSHRPAVTARPLCPGHISTELAFMAHCLERQMGGTRDSANHADEFLVQHLSKWADVFTGAVQSSTANEVMRFSAHALALFIEAEVALVRRRNPGVMAPSRA